MNKIVFLMAVFVFTAFVVMSNNLYCGNSANSDISNKPDSILNGSVKGVLSGNFNYLVKSNITVGKNDTLIIEPGATLNFDDKIRFDVYGYLKSAGTETDSIVFTSSDSNYDWLGIRFLENSPAPVLKFCSFRNTDAIDNFRGALSFQSSKFYGISDCSFMNNKAGAIYLKDVYTDSILVKNILIKNSEDFGLSYDHGRVIGDIKFYNNTILGNKDTEKGFTGLRIKYLDSCRNLDFQGNNFQNCRYKSDHLGGAIVIDETNLIQNIKFQDDIIYQNIGKQGGIYLYLLNSLVAKNISVIENAGVFGGCYINGNSINIENSTFKNNQSTENQGGGGLTINPAGNNPVITITNSLFESNGTYLANGGAINLLGNNASVSSFNIDNCRFDGNSAVHGGAVSLQDINSLGSLNISKNTFVNNYAKLGSGGVLNVINVQKIGSVFFQDSDTLHSNSAYSDGGVLNFSNVKLIDIFIYKGNAHGKGFSNFAKSGNGGIGNINVGQISSFSMEGNKDIFSYATNEGGAFYLKSDRINNLNFNGNKSATLKAKDGGLLFVDCPNITSLKLNLNEADSCLVSGNGGVFNINSETNLNKLEITNNTFKYVNSAKGGVIYFTGTIPVANSSILIGQNKITDKTSANLGDGGFGYMSGNISGDFNFIGNNIQSSLSKGNGGVFFISNSGGILKSFLVSDNKIANSSSSEASGGMFYYSGALIGAVNIADNTFDKSNSDKDGGAFNIINTKVDGNLDLEIKNNTIGSVASANGAGGFLNFSGRINGKFSFTNDFVSESSSAKQNGGLICLNNTNGNLYGLMLSNNMVSKCSTSQASGGLIYYSGSVSDSIRFLGNKVDNSLSLNSGGVILINNTKIDGNLDCEISNNVVGDIKTIAGAGGFLNFSGKANGSFLFTDNTFKSSSSVQNGGLLCINNSNGELSNLEISGNKVSTTSSSQGSGGFLYYAGAVAAPVLITGNTIDASKSKLDGGAFYVQNTKTEGNLDFDIENNNLGIIESTSGGGGFLYFTGRANGGFNFANNVIKSASSVQNGGLIFFDNSDGLLSAFSVSKNKITSTSSSQANGGLLYYNGAISTSIVIEDNPIDTSKSSLDGGAFYFHNTKIDGNLDFEINRNTIGVAESTSGAGGFFNFTGRANGGFTITNNRIKSSSSAKNGGFICVNNSTGELNNLLISKNKVSSFSSSDQSGGLFYYKGLMSNSVQISGNEIKKSESGTDGGAFAIINDKVIGLSNFDISDNVNGAVISRSGSGGFIKYDGNIPGKINISGNSYADSCFAGINGGAYAFQSKLIKDIELKSETIATTIAGNNGGFLSVNADSLNSLSMSDLTVGKKAKAGEKGGLVSLKVNNNASQLILKNNVISGSLEANSGGLIAFEGNLQGKDKIFSINNNTINAAIKVSQNGGLLYFDGKLSQDLLINQNNFNNSISAGINGGIIYLNNSGTLKSITISENNCNNPVSNLSLRAANGGFLYSAGDYSLDSLHFINNVIKFDLVKVDSAGGLIFFKNSANRPILNVDISNNTVPNLEAGTSGGWMYADAAFSNKFRFNNNSIKNSSAAEGGVLNIVNESATGLSEISIGRNILDNGQAVTGSGAFLNYSGISVNSIGIHDNTLKKAYSGHFGSFSFKTRSINQFSSAKNKFTGSSKDNGSIYYFEGDSVHSAMVDNDIFMDCKTDGSGAGIYFNVKKITDLKFDSIHVNSIEAKKSGGFGGFGDGIYIKNFTFSNNLKDDDANCFSLLNGGLFCINGVVAECTIENNNFKNIYSGENGGLIYFNGLEGSKETSKLSFNNNICKNNKDIITGGKGGVLYLAGLNSVNIGANRFNDIRSENSGGVAYIDSTIFSNFERNVSYRNKSESGFGGVVYSEQVDTAIFKGNKYNSNAAETGGTLYFTKGFIHMTNDSVYYGNANSKAGGLYISSAEGKIDSSCIQNNFLNDEGFTAQGSGIFLSKMLNKGISFSDNVFRKNSGGYGSAVYLENSKSRFVRNKFIDNVSSKGGAVYFSEGSSDSQLLNCLFYQNISGEPLSGSAIMIYPSNPLNPTVQDTLRIINCTIFNHNYYGIYIDKSNSSNSSCLVMNSIIHGNNYQSETSAQIYVPSTISYDLQYSNIEDVNQGNFKSCIDRAPGLKEYSFCLEDFSPCLNSGDPSPVFYDRLPVSVANQRNDMGITGGPERYASCEEILRPDSCCLTYYKTTDLAEAFEVYPNPASQMVNVKYTLKDYSDARIEIVSLYGQTVISAKICEDSGTQIASINISTLPKGIYVLCLITSNKIYSKQLIKI